MYVYSKQVEMKSYMYIHMYISYMYMCVYECI